jgi:hypothetical protein
VPLIETVKTPWGQRLIPVTELERFLHEPVQPSRPRAVPRPPGRPAVLPAAVVDRIRPQYARGQTLGEIARALTSDAVPTAHGGRSWWPSTVRAVLIRSSPFPSGEAGA